MPVRRGRGGECDTTPSIKTLFLTLAVQVGDAGDALGYTIDLPASARRHFQSAEQLIAPGASPKRPDVAGYLNGIAAECAIKQMMRESGMRRLDQSRRREDPYFAHFPELKTLLRDGVDGRRANELRRCAENAQLMQDWSTEVRYAPSKDIPERRVMLWREQHA